MKLRRRYQLLPDHATCRYGACTFESKGADAEQAGREHAEQSGHQVWVETSAVVVLSTPPAETVTT